MLMGLPLFLLFAVYGVVNAYLPILLRDLGYSATMIGVLQGVFEAAGLAFPLFVSARVDRRGNYGIVMIALSLLMVAVLPALALARSPWITAAALAVFAVGFKGAVPVGDALISRRLGEDSSNYGKIRVMGSIGFVCMALLLQFTSLVNPESSSSIALWIAIPALLYAVSIVASPGLLKSYPHGPVPEKREPISLKGFGPSFWFGFVLIFLAFLGMTPSQRFFSLYVREYLKLDAYAGLWALSALAEVPFMFLSGKFIRKFGTERVLFASLLAISARNLVYAAFPSFGGAVAGQLFHSVCFGLLFPALIVFVNERAPRKLIALALTLYTSVSIGIASFLGNVLGGIVIDTLGYRALFILFSVFPAIGCVLCVRFRQVFRARD